MYKIKRIRMYSQILIHELLEARKSVKKAQNTNLHKLVLINKAPLSKSLSMPDMENRIKKRERLLAYVPFFFCILSMAINVKTKLRSTNVNF